MLDRVRPWLAAILFFAAFAYRLIGIGWGLPNNLHNQSYHPDEQIIFDQSQRIEPAKLNFAPGFYSYGTFYLTLLRVGSDAVATYSGAPKEHDPASYWAYVGRVHLFGRVLSALAGAGTCVVVFIMMRRFTRLFGALFAGIMIAVAPGFVVHSRFQTVDVLATFLLAVSLYYSTKLLPPTTNSPFQERGLNPRLYTRYVVLSGLFAGLSAGTKYTGILALLSLFVALLISTPQPASSLPNQSAEGTDQKQDPWNEKSSRSFYMIIRPMALGLLAAFVGFAISTPGAFTDSHRFFQAFGYEMFHMATGHGLIFVNVGSGYFYHLVNLVAGIGTLMLPLCIAGLALALLKKQKWAVVLLAFSLVYYILIGHAEVLFLRYTFPLYIVLAAGLGWWIGFAHERKGKQMAVVALGILALGLALAASAQMTVWMAGTDPRDQVALALKTVDANRPTSTVGVVQDPWYYTPPLVPDSAISRQYFEPIVVPEMAASREPHLEQVQPHDDWDQALITQLKPDYIVYSSFEEYDLERLKDANNLTSGDRSLVDRYIAFQQLLTKWYEAVPMSSPDAEVAIPDLEYIRPYIWVWKRKGLK